MVNLACLISNGYEILIVEQLDDFGKCSYILPECSAESIERAQKIIKEQLDSEKILFDYDTLLYKNENTDDCQLVLYLCHAFQWTGLNDKSSYKWIDVRELANGLISSIYKEITDATNKFFARREKILSEIRLKIGDMFDQRLVEIEIGEQFD